MKEKKKYAVSELNIKYDDKRITVDVAKPIIVDDLSKYEYQELTPYEYKEQYYRLIVEDEDE